MPFKRIVMTVVIVSPGGGPAGPNEYLCGYGRPLSYTLDVGNPPGSQVLDVRAEWAPLKIPSGYFLLPGVDVVDDSHVSLACQCGDDVVSERAEVRLIILVAL
jgi:hypothetical protein